jgi:hypothetical protein
MYFISHAFSLEENNIINRADPMARLADPHGSADHHLRSTTIRKKKAKKGENLY